MVTATNQLSPNAPLKQAQAYRQQILAKSIEALHSNIEKGIYPHLVPIETQMKQMQEYPHLNLSTTYDVFEQAGLTKMDWDKAEKKLKDHIEAHKKKAFQST
jgi:hypothetical protein